MSGVAVPGAARAARAADANHVSALSRSAACSRQGEQVNIVSCEHQHPSPALSGYVASHLSRVWVASDAGSVGVLPGHAAGLTHHLALAHHQVTLFKAFPCPAPGVKPAVPVLPRGVDVAVAAVSDAVDADRLLLETDARYKLVLH